MERAVLSWSGGKDAAYALFALDGTAIHVEELLTTVSESTDRSTMHGVRRALYEEQGSALGLPITIVALPDDPSNEEYEAIMNDRMARYADSGIDRVVFGDLFLEDVRSYRQERLRNTPLDGSWPLWGTDTNQFIRAFLDAGFEAIVVAADADHFDQEVTGRTIDESFLADLPSAVDPAGEYGEFHTFVCDGPPFETPVRVTTGDRVTRSVGRDTTMHYCDLLPVEE